MKGRQDLVNARVTSLKYVSIYLKRACLLARWPVRHIKLATTLNVTTNAWYIFWHVRLALSSMLVVPQIVSDIVGTITNVMTENLQEGRLVCKNIFLNILIVKGIMGSYMTFQFHWSIKPMQKIQSNENTTLTTLAPHGLNIEDEF